MFNTLGNTISRNGLVGEWLLDGNVLDTNDGTKNNGTATNVTWVKTNKGYQSQTGSFNGINSNVNLGTNKFPTLVNNCTLSAWVKSNSISIPQSIFSNGDTLSGGDMGWCFGIKLDGVNNTYTFRKLGIINENTGITPSVGKDDFICLTITSNVGRLYINSVLVWTGVDSNAISNNTQKTKIGCHTSNSSNTQFYNGNIQGVRLYNRVLSQDEIQLLYLEGLRKLGPTNIAKYPSLLSGLVGYWDMKGTAHNLVDGVLATVTGATITTDRFGNAESAYNFDGVNDKIETTLKVPNNNNVSFECWIYDSSANNTSGRIIAADSGGGYFILQSNRLTPNNDGKVSFNIYSGGDKQILETTAHNKNQWYHYVGVLTGGVQYLYRDGVLQGSQACGNIGNIANGLDFGTNNNTWWFQGKIGTVRVYNRGLSANEVKTLYNLTSQDYIYPTPSYDLESLRDGLVLDLNEQGQDLSGNGNNGFLFNLAPPNQLRQGRAKGLTYNGTSQYINLGNVLNFDTNTAFTLSAWVKTSKSTTYKTIMSKITGSTQYKGWSFAFIDAENSIFFDFSYNFSVNNWIGWKCNLNIVDGKWHQVGISYIGSSPNSSSSYKFYIDGMAASFVKRNLYTISGTVTTTTDATIGARPTGSFIHGMNGNIVSPKAWNRALSGNEIQALYYSQKANFIY